MNNIAIKVENISKCYRIGVKEQIHETFAGTIVDFIKSPLKNYRKYRSLYKFDDINPNGNDSVSSTNSSGIIWALKDISFEVPQGEAVAIIGRNGAGKSTILKILSRITCPTSGHVEIRGRVSSLLEVGTGFHPELTGRENIYLNGTVLGMKKMEIDRKFDEIVDFSGVEKFIDTPVKRYSSGMKVRLAFSVAAHLEPEILLIDEVLAVGDAEFQKKCLGKMKNIGESGRTILFVSHNMVAIEAFCKHCMFIKDGKTQLYSDTKYVISAYLSSSNPEQTASLKGRKDRRGNGNLLVSKISISDEDILTKGIVRSGSKVSITIHYENITNEIQNHIYVDLGIYDAFGRAITYLQNLYYKQPLVANASHGVFSCFIEKFPLSPGNYYLNVALVRKNEILDWVQQGCSFTVEEGDFFGKGERPYSHTGGVFIEHNWE